MRRSGSGAPASVDWSVVPGGGTTAVLGAGADYLTPGGAMTGTLVFDEDVMSLPLPIDVFRSDDTVPDGARTITFELSNPQPSGWPGGASVGTPGTALLTLTDDDVGVRFALANPTVNESRSSVSVTVLRTGPTNQAVTVTYATGDGADTATPAASQTACSPGADYRPITAGSLTFNPGQSTKTIKVSLCGDGVVEGNETLTLRLTGVTPPGQLIDPFEATLTIEDND